MAKKGTKGLDDDAYRHNCKQHDENYTELDRLDDKEDGSCLCGEPWLLLLIRSRLALDGLFTHCQSRNVVIGKPVFVKIHARLKKVLNIFVCHISYKNNSFDELLGVQENEHCRANLTYRWKTSNCSNKGLGHSNCRNNPSGTACHSLCLVNSGFIRTQL